MTKLQFCDKKYTEGTALTVLDSEEVGRRLGFKYGSSPFLVGIEIRNKDGYSKIR